MLNKEELYKKIVNLGIFYLAKSSKTEKELSLKLKLGITKYLNKASCLHEFSDVLDDLISKALLFFKENNFLNDENYLNILINSYISSKNAPGILKIKQKLYAKGFSKELVDERLLLIEESTQLSSAKSLLDKKYRQLLNKSFTETTIKQKLFAYLLSKGYSVSVVKDALKSVYSVK